MDYARDEVRRQVAASQREHDAAIGRWRSALAEVFDPDGRVGDPEKAALLAVPTRRQFLRIGGLTLAGSAILVACGDDPDDAGTGGESTTTGGGESTATSEGAGTTVTTAAAATESDLTLLRTASSIEVLAIEAYRSAIDSGLVTDQAVADAAALFQQQHEDHNGLLAAQTESLGGEAYTQPNPYLQENVVAPVLAAAGDQRAVVQLAADLEQAAAQTYALAGGALSTPTLRQAIMSIGGVEARHLAVLLGVLDGAGTPQVPVGFMPTTGAAPEESYV